MPAGIDKSTRASEAVTFERGGYTLICSACQHDEGEKRGGCNCSAPHTTERRHDQPVA